VGEDATVTAATAAPGHRENGNMSHIVTAGRCGFSQASRYYARSHSRHAAAALARAEIVH